MLISEENKSLIDSLCEIHLVEKLYLFGSATGSQFTSTRDIDFLVKFRKIDLEKYFDNYISLKEKLKNIFNREVDLVEGQTLKNPILIKFIEKNKELIYG
ncbi:nucleotidyltransferase domain-containing protein [Tamlana agarivorans]|uniref:Nucleotidyltransferase domain-containing protein n=1 Tax=Pseudotamlana agarivorans TaxID=481183 RepID=A0ACC5U948_9FLAO|nr:nucleotidyltransferase domain-containing protein [Tamlana agarivorans]MBU2950710.1 nucleotidyltransferase domain-containing protein [Tamlana agarivorans]